MVHMWWLQYKKLLHNIVILFFYVIFTNQPALARADHNGRINDDRLENHEYPNKYQPIGTEVT